MQYLLILFIISIYYPIVFTFFQQDEWYDFGYEQIYWINSFGIIETIKKSLSSISPVVQLINLINYRLFGIQNVIPSFLVLILLIVNSFVWFYLIYKISNNKFIASFSLLFGYLSYIAHQSITWVMPAIPIQLSFLFINLSLIFYLQYREKKKIRFVGLIVASVIMAFLSKINSFFILLFLPLVTFIEYKNIIIKRLYNRKNLLIIILVSTLCYLLFFHRFEAFNISGSRFVQSKVQIASNILFLPIKGISQIILIRPAYIYNFSELVLTKYYKHPSDDYLKYILLPDFISVLLSIPIIISFIIIVRKLLPGHKKIISIISILYFLSFIPYSFDLFSTGKGYLESRYYNIGSFLIGLLMSYALYGVISFLMKISNRIMRRITVILLLLCISIYISLNIYYIRADMSSNTFVSKKRIQILSYIKNDFHSQFDNRFIIYVGDTNYLSTNGNNFTGKYFQTGLLYPILVDNYAGGLLPASVFSDNTFWDMNYQGVIRNNVFEIGYYYDYNELLKYVKENNFPTESIIGLGFDYSSLDDNKKSNGNYKDIVFAEYHNITSLIRDNIERDIRK